MMIKVRIPQDDIFEFCKNDEMWAKKNINRKSILTTDDPMKTTNTSSPSVYLVHEDFLDEFPKWKNYVL